MEANINELSIDMIYQAEDFDPRTAVLREEIALKTREETYLIPAPAPWIPNEPTFVSYPKYCFKKYWGNVNWTVAHLADVLLIVCEEY
jgi:hypothetical protein